jgi:hypothetical protein
VLAFLSTTRNIKKDEKMINRKDGRNEEIAKEKNEKGKKTEWKSHFSRC